LVVSRTATVSAAWPTSTQSERLALAGYLAGYRGLTREAYTLDLRQFTGWCRARSLDNHAGRSGRCRRPDGPRPEALPYS
jgi:hypothetical protein